MQVLGDDEDEQDECDEHDAEPPEVPPNVHPLECLKFLRRVWGPEDVIKRFGITLTGAGYVWKGKLLFGRMETNFGATYVADRCKCPGHARGCFIWVRADSPTFLSAAKSAVLKWLSLGPHVPSEAHQGRLAEEARAQAYTAMASKT